jgi:hypothetical protein
MRHIPLSGSAAGGYACTAIISTSVVTPAVTTLVSSPIFTSPNNSGNVVVAQPKLDPKAGGGNNSVLVSAAMKPQQFAIHMGPPKVDPMTTTTYEVSAVQPRSRLSAVMQVRCKAISAYLYVGKYESGSKGKCIQLGEEWLTPNEFEEKSGSKAKKYLSSIKCLGRPLRAFVNSGKSPVLLSSVDNLFASLKQHDN